MARRIAVSYSVTKEAALIMGQLQGLGISPSLSIERCIREMDNPTPRKGRDETGMTKIKISLPQEVRDDLCEYAEKEGYSMSAIVDALIVDVMPRLYGEAIHAQV